MRWNRSGSAPSIHAYCWAWEQANRYSGYSSIRRTADAKVRMHLRTVSRIGHNQAVSMWAWPLATMRWPDDGAGACSAGASTARALAMSGYASSARANVRSSRGRRGSSRASVAHQPVEHLDVVRQRFCLAVDHRQVGATKAVERMLAGRLRRAQLGRNELRERRIRCRFEVDRQGPWRGVNGISHPARVDALHGPASIVDHQCLALEAGRVGPEPGIDDRLDSLPGPLVRHRAAEHEPGRSPRRSPLGADHERRLLLTRRPGGHRQGHCTPFDARQHPLVQFAA